jgi:hypothetical protein
MSIKVKVAVGSVLLGISALAVAVQQGLAYNEETDPGALNAMVVFFITSAAFLLVPASMIAAWFVRAVIREITGSGLTSGQVATIGAVGMAVAGYEWSEYNKRVSAQLTESVMGPERGAEGPWG